MLAGSTPKGYYREAFEEAFSVYIPPPTATPPKVNNDGHFRDFQTATLEKPVAVRKPRIPITTGIVAVALQSPSPGKRRLRQPGAALIAPSPATCWSATMVMLALGFTKAASTHGVPPSSETSRHF